MWLPVVDGMGRAFPHIAIATFSGYGSSTCKALTTRAGRDTVRPSPYHRAMKANALLVIIAVFSSPITFGGGPVQAQTDGFRVASGSHVLSVRPQSPDDAYAYLSSVVSQMGFFRANGYQVALPSHTDFDADGEFGSLERFRDVVYREAAFRPALDVLAEGRSVLQGALDWFVKIRGIDGFRVFDNYSVEITLYGPGGSYDPSSGGIVLFATEDGRFRGGGGVHTIVHEMMHLAVEEGFVQKYGLSHWEKERLVDLLTKRELGHLLPGYQLQAQGVEALDSFVRETPLDGLSEALERYRNQ